MRITGLVRGLQSVIWYLLFGFTGQPRRRTLTYFLVLVGDYDPNQPDFPGSHSISLGARDAAREAAAKIKARISVDHALVTKGLTTSFRAMTTACVIAGELGLVFQPPVSISIPDDESAGMYLLLHAATDVVMVLEGRELMDETGCADPTPDAVYVVRVKCSPGRGGGPWRVHSRVVETL